MRAVQGRDEIEERIRGICGQTIARIDELPPSEELSGDEEERSSTCRQQCGLYPVDVIAVRPRRAHCRAALLNIGVRY